MKEWAKGFYSSAVWHKCRSGYIAHRIACDGGMCEECGERLGDIVHHKITLTQGNISDGYVSLNWEQLAYVCQQCHNRIHNGKSNERGVEMDGEGNVIATAPPSRERYMD